MSLKLSEHLGVDRARALALLRELSAVYACPYCILRYLKVETRRWYTMSTAVRRFFLPPPQPRPTPSCCLYSC